MSNGCPKAIDASFGPWAGTYCRGGFDYTLFFEQSILTIAPVSLFLLASPIRFYILAKCKPVTSNSRLRILKLVTASTFAVTQLVLLVLWGVPLAPRNTASVPSGALSLIAAVFVIALSWLEDSRSIQPSTLLSTYLIVTVLLDVPQARTLWLQRSSVFIASMFSANIGIKLALLFLESRSKVKYLRPAEHRLHSPESVSGIINRSLMWWLNPLFLYGYKALINSDALYHLDKDLSADNLQRRVYLAWARRRVPERRFEYLLAMSKVLWWPFLQAATLRFFLIGFTFAQPFLITSAVGLLATNHDRTADNTVFGLIGATALIYVGMAVSKLLSAQKLYRTTTMFRGATVSLIYSSALQMQDGLYDESASIAVMSTDTDRVSLAIYHLNEVWARLIEVVIAIFLLTRQLGWVAVIPLVIVIFGFIGGAWICRDIGTNVKVWTDAVQERIARTSSVLSEMKAVKMMGLSKALTALIQAARVEETRLMVSFRHNLVWALLSAMTPGIWGPAATFAVFSIQASVNGTGAINATQAFTALSLISLLCDPASILVQSVVDVFAAVGCSDRIQKFLLSPQREDQRHIPAGGLWAPSIQSLSSDTVELKQLPKNEDFDSLNGMAVSVYNAHIRPAASAAIVLHGVSFDIPRGSITMAIGLIGSGKTTLLRALLGEIVCEQGSVKLCSRRVSFCSQSSWLPNTTIRQAIYGPIEADAADNNWYRSVLDACDLSKDLEKLQNGDQTIIGSASTALSGGQKQRVALARAIHARADIYILDDVLSALDSKTKQTIVKNLFGEDGLFRKLKSTVILVTHESKCLAYADQVLAISNGQLRSAATYKELLRDGLPVVTATSNEDHGDDGGTEESRDVVAHTKTTGNSVSEQERTITPAENARATGDWSTYKYYFNAIGPRDGVLFVLLTALSSFFMSFGSIWLQIWTKDGGDDLAFYISIYLLLALLATVCLGGQVWSILCLIGPSTGLKLHKVLLHTVMRAPQAFFSSTDFGTILNRFSQDMTLIDGTLPAGMLQTVSNIFLVAFSIALVATGSGYMATTIPLLVLTLWVLQRFYLRTSRQLRLLDLEARSPLYSHFLEGVHGLVTIRAFGWERSCRDELLRLLDHSQRPYYLMYCIQRWLTLVLDLIVAAEAVLVVGLALGLRSATSAGLLGVSLNSILAFNKNVRNLIEGWTEFETSLGSIARVRNFEQDVAPEAREGEDRDPPAIWPQCGEIEFRNVTASHKYGRRTLEGLKGVDTLARSPEAVVLHDVSLKISPGKKFGICGRSGSGKSSLIGALLRLLEINSGRIIIDGLDLTTLPRETIRERLIAIPQETLILTGSLRLNVDPTNSHPDSVIIAALESVGLWSLLEERGGLDANITDSGLSKGQQQLLALSRAILRKSKIILLDEPTSNVDSETDATLQAVLKENFGDCTVLMVAHRLDSIMGCDAVAVVDEGKLVEVGPPGELMARQDSWFASLARR